MSVLHNCYNVDTGPGVTIVAGVITGIVVFSIIVAITIIALVVLVIFTLIMRQELAGGIQLIFNWIQRHNIIGI